MVEPLPDPVLKTALGRVKECLPPQPGNISKLYVENDEVKNIVRAAAK